MGAEGALEEEHDPEWVRFSPMLALLGGLPMRAEYSACAMTA